MMQRFRPSGLTLVELLVVVAIIGVLAALLLPTVQSAREPGRRAQCKNNLKQLTLGCLNHASTLGHFPTGGWGHAWVGDADRGFGRGQSGGWLYNVSPFLEQQHLHALPSDGDPDKVTDQQRAGALLLIKSVLPNLNCPSRRANSPHQSVTSQNAQLANCARVPPAQESSLYVGKSDYAMNQGQDAYLSFSPASLAEAAAQYKWTNDELGNQILLNDRAAWGGRNPSMRYIQPLWSGLSFQRSLVRPRNIEDGASTTYLAGSKSWTRRLGSGEDDAQGHGNWSMGPGYANYRMGIIPPLHDSVDDLVSNGVRLAKNSRALFGSAHSYGLHMSYCDGHVAVVAFDIDPMVHRQAAHRSDGGRPLRIDDPDAVMFPYADGYR